MLLSRSPSSRSALAESELEYNDQHKSLSAFFRFNVSSFILRTLFLIRLLTLGHKCKSFGFWSYNTAEKELANAIVCFDLDDNSVDFADEQCCHVQ